MGVKANRPKQLIDCMGNLIVHTADDELYKGKYASTTIRYHCFARPGVGDEEARWKIYRETLGDGPYDTGSTIAIEHANGSSDYKAIRDASSAVIISGISKASPGQVTTTTAHGLSDGDSVEIDSVVGMTEVNENFFTITVVDSTNFTIGINTGGYTPYGSVGNVYKRDYANYTYS